MEEQELIDGFTTFTSPSKSKSTSTSNGNELEEAIMPSLSSSAVPSLKAMGGGSIISAPVHQGGGEFSDGDDDEFANFDLEAAVSSAKNPSFILSTPDTKSIQTSNATVSANQSGNSTLECTPGATALLKKFQCSKTRVISSSKMGNFGTIQTLSLGLEGKDLGSGAELLNTQVSIPFHPSAPINTQTITIGQGKFNIGLFNQIGTQGPLVSQIASDCVSNGILQKNDVIKSVNGKEVRTSEEFRELASSNQQTRVLEIVRNIDPRNLPPVAPPKMLQVSFLGGCRDRGGGDGGTVTETTPAATGDALGETVTMTVCGGACTTPAAPNNSTKRSFGTKGNLSNAAQAKMAPIFKKAAKKLKLTGSSANMSAVSSVSSAGTGKGSAKMSAVSSTSSAGTGKGKRNAKIGPQRDEKIKEFMSNMSPLMKEKKKTEAKTKNGRAMRALVPSSFTPKSAFVRGESNPITNNFNPETVKLCNQVTAAARAVVIFKEGLDQGRGTKTYTENDDHPAELIRLEDELYKLVLLLKKSHPGIRWDSKFEYFVRAPYDCTTPENFTESYDPNALYYNHSSFTVGTKRLTLDHLQKALHARGFHFPDGVKFAKLTYEIMEECNPDWTEGNILKDDSHIFAVTSSGLVFRAKKMTRGCWAFKWKVGTNGMEIEDADWILKNEVIVETFGHEMSGSDGRWTIRFTRNGKKVKAGQASCSRNRVVKIAFEGLPDDRRKNIVDHVSHNRSDDRVEHLRWVTPKENAENLSNSGGIVGHIGQWLKKMGKRHSHSSG